MTSLMNRRKKVKRQDGKKVDPDQTASVFKLFAQSCLCKYSRIKAVGSEDRRQTYLGDICIQNFHLGRYIVGYTVGNLVLLRCTSRAVKRDFRTFSNQMLRYKIKCIRIQVYLKSSRKWPIMT